MTGEIEAGAEPGNAALIANAIDPPTTAAAHGICANCAATLTGNFCANCGQKAHLHRSLADVGHEFVHGITHFDGKAWKTLPMLALHPGRLTRDYIMGHRARHIAPVPLFLLVVFLMFFFFSFIRIPIGGPTGINGKPMTQAEAITQLPAVDAELADLDRQIVAAKASRDPSDLAGLEGVRKGVAAARGQIKARAEGEVGDPAELPGAIARAVGGDDLAVNLGNETINEKARKALKNPDLVLFKIQGKAYKLSFLLVPLSLPWLWLMFAWKRDVRMYDHAIFALYSISFMSLLFVAGSLAIAAGVSWGLFWFLLVCAVPVVHMFAQLKGAYALGRFGAAWRTAALAFASIITLSIYAIIMIVLGVVD